MLEQPTDSLAVVTPLATRIAWARTKSGVSIEDLARAIGTTPPIIDMWENGTIEPNDVQLGKLAERTTTLFYWLKHGEVIAPPLAQGNAVVLSHRLGDFALRFRRAYGNGGPDFPLLCEAVGAAKKLEQLSKVAG